MQYECALRIAQQNGEFVPVVVAPPDDGADLRITALRALERYALKSTSEGLAGIERVGVRVTRDDCRQEVILEIKPRTGKAYSVDYTGNL